jgi:hypothetical protein
MKKIRILVVTENAQPQNFKFSIFDGENVESIALISYEDQEENVAQLLHCNLVVCENLQYNESKIIKDFLQIARLMDKEVIHISRIGQYVK